MNTALIRSSFLGLAMTLALSLQAGQPQPTLSAQIGSYTGTALTFGAQATALGALCYSAYHGLRCIGYAAKSVSSSDDYCQQERNTSLAKSIIGLCTAGIAHATTHVKWTGLLLQVDLGALIGGLLNYAARNSARNPKGL